ncbi:hypothetical protein [Curtobacterium sp. MCBD17_040]|uniref:hypothetical protein n=1 Tax=Curtobacterium sp. MCBD17_040 TaxID=2175674 RepID=UPI000DA863EA|nr:hypothetical protein [Curtobacterium sp. MCBD17_040]WIB65419.1 hypothetical protein DEI94_18605 [Curtobacterium sp. MCBD17_040]
MSSLTDFDRETKWQEYLRTATAPNGERLTPASPHYSSARGTFEAGWDARDAEVEALRQDLNRALGVGDANVTEEVVVASPAEVGEDGILATEADRVLAHRVLSAVASEARDIERIGQTPFAHLYEAETVKFNDHPLARVYRSEDPTAHITWLDQAAGNALAGHLPVVRKP